MVLVGFSVCILLSSLFVFAVVLVAVAAETCNSRTNPSTLCLFLSKWRDVFRLTLALAFVMK